MNDSKKQMTEKILKLFSENLILLEKKVPSNGIWSVCSLLDTEYQGAVRVIPSESEENIYLLWVDVFETIYDPVFSNTLYKGNLQEIRSWLRDESNAEEVYNCMHHLYVLAVDD